MKTEKSRQMFARAQQLIPGGVDSPVRACKSVGCDPVFIQRASGANIYDVDGNSYIDYIGSWGPMILGHNHPAVSEAIKKAMVDGTSFGAPCGLEIELAELVIQAVPSIEMVRFVSSGTEATMSAIRLARGYTGRNVVIKFDGGYHGHADSFLVKAGSGVITLGIPGSPGVPEDIVKNTVSIPYNDAATLEETLRSRALDIACVIIEPIAGNMGVVAPSPGFLQKLRDLTTELGIVLIFDEVITGFRTGLGGAQEKYGITPDLTCLGKIIGGGLPVGAYGGKKELMQMISPVGPVYQAGTLSGNPLAMAAGKATLLELMKPGFYEDLNRKAEGFGQRLGTLANKHLGGKFCINQVGSVLTLFFTGGPVTDFASAMHSDTKLYGQYYREMLAAGIYLAPAQFEGMFMSAAHTEDDFNETLTKAESVFRKLA
ncbi:MAG: glutamate-1-semialdehyde 2,1-aminomutase [Desulfobulbaceae bacterium]|nr:glutamate-1-semialdehyde 2,1-aminomutase [Desulfobulbaceae bacterium]